MIFVLLSAATGVPISASTIIIALLSLAGTSAAGVLIAAVFNRRKTSAESEKTQAEARQISQSTAMDLITTLREEIARKDAEHSLEMAEMRAGVAACRERLDVAEAGMKAAADRAERAEFIVGRLNIQVDRLEAELNRYKLRVSQLEAHLTANGLQPPPWPTNGA